MIRLAILLAFVATASSRGGERPPKKLTLTYDPLLPVMQTFQFSTEFRPVPNWSGLLIFGGGGEEEPSYFRQFHASWKQFGAQARWYPRAERWTNPHAFVHAVFERAFYTDFARQEYGDAEYEDDLWLAAGWGWKLMHRRGFTFEFQIGLVSIFDRQKARAWGYDVTNPYANTGLGWSFF